MLYPQHWWVIQWYIYNPQTDLQTYRPTDLDHKTSSPSWELELRPLGVATGNASSVTRVWRYICKNTIRWPATAHDVTTGATIIKGSPGEYIISFFVFTDWSVWRNVHSGRNTVFLYLSWRALARRSRSVWIRVLVIWHPMTHTIVASFVWAKSTHAMSLRGQSACTVSFLYEKAPFSSVPLFEKRGAAVCFPRFGTHRCRGTEAIEIAGFAVGYGRWVREGPPLFACVGRKREWAAGLWWCDLSDIIRFSG